MAVVFGLAVDEFCQWQDRRLDKAELRLEHFAELGGISPTTWTSSLACCSESSAFTNASEA